MDWKKLLSLLKMFSEKKLNRTFESYKGNCKSWGICNIHGGLHKAHRKHPQKTGRTIVLFMTK